MFRELFLCILVRVSLLDIVSSKCGFYTANTHMFCSIGCLDDILSYSDLSEVESILINLKDTCKPVPLHWLDKRMPNLTDLKVRSQSCPFNTLFTNLKLKTLQLSHYVEGKEFFISEKNLVNSNIILEQPELAHFAISMCWPLLPRLFNLPKLENLLLYGEIPEVHINGDAENLRKIKNVKNFTVNIYAPKLQKIVMKYQTFLYAKTLANIKTLKHFEYTGKEVEILEEDFIMDLPNLNLVDISGKAADELEKNGSLCKNLGAKNVRRVMFEGNLHSVCPEIFRCDNCTRDYYEQVNPDEIKMLELSENIEMTQSIIGIMTGPDPIPIKLNTSSLITFHDAANMNKLLKHLPNLNYLSILLRKFPREVEEIVYQNLRNISRLQLHVTICDKDGLNGIEEFVKNLTKLNENRTIISSHCGSLECSDERQMTIEKGFENINYTHECSGTIRMAKTFIIINLIFSILIHIR